MKNTQKISPRRVLGRTLAGFASLALILSAAILARPLFAQTLDIHTYTEKMANEYYALPVSGPNFSANSRLAYGLGRHYLKGKAVATIVAAYAELAARQPQYHYVYGEMGWKGGGQFRPHRTHREGLTADFMTPMLINGPDGQAIPARLPSSVFNLWGYNIRLSSDGASKKMRLNTKAMIAHLAALKKTAPKYGLRIERVIFDPPLLKILRRDPAFPQLRGLTFMNGQAWFPHDGHYHVDFK